MGAKKGPFGGWSRAVDGFIVTIRNQVSGEMISRLYQGERAPQSSAPGKRFLPITVTIEDLLGDLAADVDELGRDWKIASLSTPTSIYWDVVGRDLSGSGPRPAEYSLALIERMDLLEKEPAYEKNRIARQKRGKGRGAT